MNFDIKNLDFNKSADGLLPAIIQDAATRQVLMLGYMNTEALEKTISSGKVTFFSRSKQRLWTKGETSANFLNLVDIKADCDNDTILIKANPDGPTCHTGSDTCWQEKNDFAGTDFLFYLESVIQKRKAEDPSVSKSYTNSLFQKGINKVAQKVGEEAVELVIESKDDNHELFLGEAADLMFHYLVLLAAKNFTLDDVLEVLKKRHS
ncbi:MAG: bifunctional phosphoribosyl-AMP cyclohydrolase/phosphoribosyl-ATP diphosphatase HisIE [Saprospiraceae bacterium]|nr:bifunctional phosphoribosyl-AMP cyclohydrolase/phosphoribosyl-ATP diphosphatase HisIE [Saprospiraceae bacterium]